MALLPRYLLKEGVVALGEIGFDDQTASEEKYYRAQLELAKELDMVVMVHTPHRDKKTGTIRSMEIALEHGIEPGRVIIDHNNEETVEEVLERGFWAAFTLYPHTKMGNERMVEIARRYGSEHIFMDSSSDWGVSDPLAVPKTAQLMLERGIKAEDVERIAYRNALAAYGQTGQMKEDDWLNPARHRPAHAVRGQLRPARSAAARGRDRRRRRGGWRMWCSSRERTEGVTRKAYKSVPPPQGRGWEGDGCRMLDPSAPQPPLEGQGAASATSVSARTGCWRQTQP